MPSLLLVLLACPPSDEPPGTSHPASCSEPTVWYPDADGDGFGDEAGAGGFCTPPPGAVAQAGDCDDSDGRVFPGEAEIVYDGLDNDCDPVTVDDDLDGDGAAIATDCDDGDGAIGPAAAEVAYDGADNDCDPATPDDDLDADGFGAAVDCDEADAAVHPLATEVPYDGLDNDCVPSTPDDDLDADGFASDADCDDSDPEVNPDATEVVYDGADNDCDAATLDDDLDSDGYPIATDCDDSAAGVHPGAVETLYDGIDNDCVPGTRDDDVDADGFVLADDCDDADPQLGGPESPYDGIDNDCDASTPDDDLDGDGYLAADDCDDVAADASPDGTEVCGDGLDNDCNGSTDCPTFALSAADVVITGAAGGDRAGSAVAAAGDVNGDGYADIVIGAPTNSDGGSFNGSGFLVLGGPALASHTLDTPDAQYTNGVSYSFYAAGGMAGAGDFDGDGFDDVLMASPNYGISNNGTTYLFLGSATPASVNTFSDPTIRFSGDTAYSMTGSMSAGVGDVNADGLDDILIGSPYSDDLADDAGKAYLVLGRAAPVTGFVTPEPAYLGERRGDTAGSSVAGPGDVNGDGFADLLIGAPNRRVAGIDDVGAAYLVLGSGTPVGDDLANADAHYDGESLEDYAGRMVSAAGDVDADGYLDFTVDAQFDDDGGDKAGAVYLVRGGASPASTDLANADAKYIGEAAGDSLGGDGMRAGSTRAGDVNGDGFGDLVLGAPSRDAYTGSAYLVLGGPVPFSMSMATADAEFTGAAANDSAGLSVSGAGDVNGDGLDDLVFGIPNDASRYVGAGAACIVFGRSTW